MSENAKTGWRADSGLPARIKTAAFLAPLVVIGVLFLPSQWFAAAFGFVLCFALWEWTRIIGFRLRRLRGVIVGANAALIGVLWLYTPEHWLMPIVYAGAVWWCLALVWLRAFDFASAPTRKNKDLKVIVGSVVVVPAWVAAWLLHKEPEQGPWWTLFVLVLIWIADAAAYFAGRRFGQHKLAPRISPGKTLEGLYGALLGAVVYAAAVGAWLNPSWTAYFCFVLLVTVTVLFSVVGDLFESLIKRHSNIKDSGTIFPGHGGMLDRIDSVLAALPIFAAGRSLFGL